MKTTCLKTLAAAAALLLVVPSLATAQTSECYFFDFEGHGNGVPIGQIDGTPIRFSAKWRTSISPAFQPSPSPTTVAFFSSLADTEIRFLGRAKSFSLFYANIVETRFDALDENGNVVWSSGTLPPLNPTGFPLSQWDILTVERPDHDIHRIVVTGGANLSAIDNFQACVIADPIELLEQLIFDVADINLTQGISNSVDAKLDAAFAAIIDVNDNNDVAACNALNALVHFVEVQWDHGKLTDEQALYLIDAVDQIIELLCPV